MLSNVVMCVLKLTHKSLGRWNYHMLNKLYKHSIIPALIWESSFLTMKTENSAVLPESHGSRPHLGVRTKGLPQWQSTKKVERLRNMKFYEHQMAYSRICI